ncbi:MAG: response regulator [Thermodesulfobacteriota bacterium]|nr:response regulator [Thermodesulfobacteriota bacterium]
MIGNILIVDQDYSHRGLLQALLEKKGYRVHVLEDDGTINDILKQEPFDILFLDSQTIKIRGGKFLSDIKKSYPASHIIIVTSKRGNGFVKEAMSVGAYGCVYKPFRNDEVLTMIRHLVPNERIKNAKNS